MAFNFNNGIWKNAFLSVNKTASALQRTITTSSVCNRVSVGRYRPIEGRKQLLTYDQAIKPHEIAHKKSWNTWNTSTLEGGRRQSLTAIEDMFIRRFIYGAWFSNVKGQQIIIKRHHNIVRIAFCMPKKLNPQAAYFMTGFSEQLLSIWLHCPVKLEIQAVEQYEGYVKIV